MNMHIKNPKLYGNITATPLKGEVMPGLTPLKNITDFSIPTHTTLTTAQENISTHQTLANGMEIL